MAPHGTVLTQASRISPTIRHFACLVTVLVACADQDSDGTTISDASTQGGGPGGCFLHHPSFDFNDEVIPLGAGYLAALVEEALPLGEDK